MTTDRFSLTGKVALVTGGNGGLGKAMAIALRRLGRLDVLVNNAGQSRGGSVLELRLQDWRAVIDPT